MLSVVSGLFILMLDPARIWENEIFFKIAPEKFFWDEVLNGNPFS